MSHPVKGERDLPTATSGTTNPHRNRDHLPRAPRDDGRRRRRHPNTATTRKSILGMERASGQFHQEIAEIYRFSGIVTKAMHRFRITSERGMQILEVCRGMSRDLHQGNLVRAWELMLKLLAFFEIKDETTLKMQRHTASRRLFVLLTENEDRRPEWDNFTETVISSYALLGVHLKPPTNAEGGDEHTPLSLRFTNGANTDPKAFDPEAWRDKEAGAGA